MWPWYLTLTFTNDIDLSKQNKTPNYKEYIREYETSITWHSKVMANTNDFADKLKNWQTDRVKCPRSIDVGHKKYQ